MIFGQRRPKNLRDHLVRAKTCYPPKNPVHTRIRNQLTRACKSPGKCNYCPKLDKSGSITSNVTSKKYASKSEISCRSNNLIYCITCTHCGKQYVGQTKNTLMERFRSHFWHIRTGNKTFPVGEHFSLTGHTPRGCENTHLGLYQSRSQEI